MKKNRILFLIAALWVSICAIDAYATLQWRMITDTGVNIAMEDVDYLMRTDDSVQFTVVIKNGDPITEISSVSFIQQSSTGNKQPAVAVDIHYYSNPVTDRLNISGIPAGTRVEIVSLEGKIMKSIESNGAEIVLSVANLPQGTYLLRTASSTLKFVKR